jgi:hypothetical protein
MKTTYTHQLAGLTQIEADLLRRVLSKEIMDTYHNNIADACNSLLGRIVPIEAAPEAADTRATYLVIGTRHRVTYTTATGHFLAENEQHAAELLKKSATQWVSTETADDGATDWEVSGPAGTISWRED